MINKNRALLGTIAAIAANTLFGFSNLFSKLTLKFAEPLFVLTSRFAVAFLALCLLGLFGVFKLNLKGKNIAPLILLGLFQPFVYMILELYGISLTSSAVSGVIISLSPILVLLFSGVFLKEKATVLQFVFSLVSFVGVSIMALHSNNGNQNYLLGIILLIFAAAAAAAYNLLNRRIASQFTAFERTFVTFAVSFIGFAVITPFAIKESLVQTAVSAFSSGEFIVSLLYLSIGSSISAFLLYNFAVSNISAVRASSFSNIITIVSLFAGVFILGEELSLIQYFGCALIIIGVYAVNRFCKKI